MSLYTKRSCFEGCWYCVSIELPSPSHPISCYSKHRYRNGNFFQSVYKNESTYLEVLRTIGSKRRAPPGMPFIVYIHVSQQWCSLVPSVMVSNVDRNRMSDRFYLCSPDIWRWLHIAFSFYPGCCTWPRPSQSQCNCINVDRILDLKVGIASGK